MITIGCQYCFENFFPLVLKENRDLCRQEDRTEFVVVNKTGTISKHTSVCRTLSIHQISVDYLQSHKLYDLSGSRLLSVVRDVWENFQ